MKTKGIILKSFIILLLLIANNYLAAQTVTQVNDLNLTENQSITLINIATSTLGKEEPGLCKYIDGSLILLNLKIYCAYFSRKESVIT